METFKQSENIPSLNEQLKKCTSGNVKTLTVDFKNEEMLSQPPDLLVLKEEILKISAGFVGLRKSDEDILFDL